MRADRLLSILMYLQTRGRSTTDRLANEFEVSRRTVIRDLYALRVAGFPVYTERGPHGGCYLHEEYRNTLTQLTTDEIAALFLSSIQEPLKDLGLSGPLRGAVLKLTAALPESRQAARSRITDRIVIDSTTRSSREGAGAHLSTLHRASMNDRWVRVVFERPFGVMTTRRIAPYGLVARLGEWFVVWDGEDGRLRVDRVSRVREAHLEDDAFDRRPAFDLGAFWTDWLARRDAAQPELAVHVRVRADAIPFVQDRLGARRGVFYGVPAPAKEWVPMDMSFPDFEEARQVLLSLGGSVEVLAPQALRRSIQDFAAQIQSLYSGRPGDRIAS